MKKHQALILQIIILYLTVAFFRLNELPGEWFGDISNVHEYTSQILRGEWPFYFFQSPGPVYHYLIAPIVLTRAALASLQGLPFFLTYKIASVLIGLIGLVGTYLLANEVAGKKIAQVTILVTSVSFWFLVFARLGNSQIIIPILTSLTVYFAYKRNLFFGVVVSSLGLFTYPQTFILPLLFLLLLVFKKEKRTVIISLLSFLPAFLLFIWVVSRQPDNFTRGYVGEKIFGGSSMSVTEVGKRFSLYLLKTFSMLHLQGDRTFRVNVEGSPQLDRISSIFFLLGAIYFFKYQRNKLPYILIPMVLLIIPSVSPAISGGEIPSSSRTIGIIPFVYLLVASGIYFSYCQIKSRKKLPATLAILFILIYIAYVNLNKYFVLYPKGLPNNNVPYGKIIAGFIDTLPVNTKIRLTACCWGQWGQPEPKAIYYVLKNKKDREYIVHEKFISSCGEVDRSLSNLIIFNPEDDGKIRLIRECFPKGKFLEHKTFGQLVFVSLYLESETSNTLK